MLFLTIVYHAPYSQSCLMIFRGKTPCFCMCFLIKKTCDRAIFAPNMLLYREFMGDLIFLIYGFIITHVVVNPIYNPYNSEAVIMDLKKLLKPLGYKRGIKQPSVGGIPLNSHRMNSYREYVDNGMCENVVVYRVISLIAKNISGIDIRIANVADENQCEMSEDEQENLLNSMTKNRNIHLLIEQIVMHMLLFGNAYLHFGPEGMEALRPDRMHIVSKEDKVLGYYYSRAKERDVRSPGMMLYNVVHLKFLHPLDDWYGLSPLQATAMSVRQHNAVAKHNAGMLENGGRPSGCFIIRSGLDFMTDGDREKFMNDLRESYQGARNAGRVMVMGGDVEWKEMAYAPKDLDFAGGRCLAAREIAMAYGVPPLLLGIDEHYSTAAYKEARYYFWEDTLLPLAEDVMRKLSAGVQKYVNPNLRCWFHYANVPALRFLQESLWERLSAAPFLSNEERRILLDIDGEIAFAKGNKHSFRKQ